MATLGRSRVGRDRLNPLILALLILGQQLVDPITHIRRWRQQFQQRITAHPLIAYIPGILPCQQLRLKNRGLDCSLFSDCKQIHLG